MGAGVAPRAKMNQQRARRFRRGLENEAEARARAELNVGGEDATPAFDTNAITPGVAQGGLRDANLTPRAHSVYGTKM